MEDSRWGEAEPPPGLDVERPSPARVHDYLLGGSHNFAVDRAVARALIAAVPDAPVRVRVARAFVHRCVRWLARTGVTQYLDIGAGIPSAGTVHGVARSAGAGARAVYVDIDPVAVRQARYQAAGDTGVAVLHADLRDPDRILRHPALRAVLDLSTPVALLLADVLPAIGDDADPYGLVRRLCAALAPGSYLVVTHASGPPSQATLLETLLSATGVRVTLRSREQVLRFLAGMQLVQPGVVWAPQWRPDSRRDVGRHPQRSGTLVGVARKP